MENLNQTDNLFKEVQEMVQSCIQCGTCSGSCLAATVMEHTPRRVWRLVQLGCRDEVLNSQSFVYCASCYYCTLRCPRGLPLTQAMAKLKEIAVKARVKKHKPGLAFYQYFVNSICSHGRVNEVELMTNYLISTKNPITSLKYFPLGMKLMCKGKLSVGNAFKNEGVLDDLFRKIKQVEAQL